MRDAHAGAGELEKIERRPAPCQHVHELARQVFAVIDVEMQRLEVIAEVHLLERGNAARELGQRNAQRQRAEDPVLLRQLAAPEILFLFGQVLETHQRTLSMTRRNSSRPPYPSIRARSVPSASAKMTVGNAFTL